MEKKIKIYWVYIHINPTNQKKYIGITSKSPEERWNHGFGYQYNKAFFYDIVKEGWDNFEHHIIFETYSKSEAEEKERSLIKQYDTQNPEFGYNQTGGGSGSLNYVSENAREAHRKNWMGKRNPNARQVLCVETGKIYDTCADAGEAIGITREKGTKLISSAAKRKGMSQGYHWRYIDE